MTRPNLNRPDLQWFDLNTGERARKGISREVYADIEDGSGRYERRRESQNFTAVYIDYSNGTETILPKEGSPDLAQNVSERAAYRAHVSHYHYGPPADEAIAVRGRSPEVADTEDAVEMMARPRNMPPAGLPRLSATERRIIENYAVSKVMEHFKSLGYNVKDVGNYESYDLHAAKDGETIKVEVKGTTSNGLDIVLTRNEVEIHQNAHPANALAIVRRIRLTRNQDADPTPSSGELVLQMPWAMDEDRLTAIAYRYRTGLQA
jgi:Domain of unknown function (DUF3883)